VERTQRDFNNSNPIQLAWREWALAALLCLAALYLLPFAWPAAGTRLSRPDYRLPGELSSDYWMFERWSEYAHAGYRAVVLGDSVVWGQYVRSDDTLAHHLNEQAGRDVFANLGLDGLHPAAMAGLVAYYGEGIEDEPVLLHLNPLWMSSAKQDLQPRGEGRFNHPKLVPQAFRRPASYAPTPAEVIEAVLEREVRFFSWKEHLNIAYWEGLGLQEWTLENPYSILPGSRGPDSFAGDEPGSEPVNWRKRGISPEDLPWVEAARSYQWQSFKRTVKLLQSRRNRVFVVLGPFNTHALTGDSRTRYEVLATTMEQWLEKEKIPHYAPRLLPSDMYADLSHPLGDGYREIAKELFGSPSFQAWTKSWGGRDDQLPRGQRPRRTEQER
jgi:hypothetical protein